MDVKQWIALLSFCCFITACSNRKDESSLLGKSAVQCGSASVTNEKIVAWKDGKFSRLKLGTMTASAVSAFMAKNQNEIRYIEDNFKIFSPKSEVSELRRGWGGEENWGPDFIKAPQLWNKGIYGDGVVVAVIDSGIDAEHNQLSMQLYTNENETLNGIDDDDNGLIDDIHGYDFTTNSGNLEDTSGHGTHVAGIIAARHENGEIKGIAPHSQLMVYDFFTADGEGTVFDAIEAMKLAAAGGAKVINASWGGPSCSRSLNETIDSLSSKNILFVSAAGNEGLNIDYSPTYPAAYEAMAHITVAAMTYDQLTAGFSNYGNIVQIAAPGVNILSTYPNNSTAYENGTSMAAPFVTGAVALLWSAFPEASARDIKLAITQAVQAGPYPVKSRGALDVAAAHAFLEQRLR